MPRNASIPVISARICMALNSCYCSLVPRSSNDAQAHLKFCFAKGACSLLNHVLTQPGSKCLAAV